MRNRAIPMFSLAIGLLMSACAKEEMSKSDNQEALTYKVSVVMPAGTQTRWKRTVDWALGNIRRAQQGLPSRIELEIEWHDENDIDIEDYYRQVARDDSYTAMIGPMTSDHARLAAGIFGETEKTIILPVASSTEFQRIFAGKDNVWNLVEPDMAQCEILLTQAKLSDASSVTLLTSDNDYGKSFSDWFAYQATELGLKVRDVFIYGNENELNEAVERIAQYKAPFSTFLLFAPGKEEDAVAFDRKYGELKGSKDYIPFPSVMCSDIVNSPTISSRLVNNVYEGISPSADPTSGFLETYKLRFGEEPINGEAHLFDAVSLIAYALQYSKEDNLNNTIRYIVDGREHGDYSWLPEDMKQSFALLAEGKRPDLRGITGDWTFDERHHASVLNTVYSHWILRDGKYTTIEYLSVDGSPRTTSSYQAWEQQSSYIQNFNPSQPTIEYGELEENWAVVISTSDTWANYRHQADALAMYQLLKRHGYDDDHIILIMEDNIAYNSHNLYPGIVRTSPDGENLYVNVKVDYNLSELDLNGFYDIMTGDTSKGLPTVLPSGKNDNVIVFWTGHGAHNRLIWGSSEEIWSWQIKDMVEAMNKENRYRKLMFVMDACYSGSIGEACTGIPGVLFITAANSNEPSKADMRDPEMGIWLSNGFTRVFQETIDTNPSISLRDLYYTLARHTVGSHSTVYNADNYGNLYKSSMNEFININN